MDVTGIDVGHDLGSNVVPGDLSHGVGPKDYEEDVRGLVDAGVR